ncbi:hypothetical protein [Nocardia asiatica]|uniref:hypothetical protein n=1 Tax=Nocardia asiatica TaxID=209252 RepID=UPI0002D747AF|nr:hypothetical protein [Nocardia asiatica]
MPDRDASSNVRALRNPAAAIRMLRAELEELAGEAALAAVSRTPLWAETHGRERVQCWYDHKGLRVLTCEGGVHLTTSLEFNGFGSDWHALGRRGARDLAHALLSAATYATTDDTDTGGES